jgi:uncharacterized protein with von Willebrand factor type A (vWA) domain
MSIFRYSEWDGTQDLFDLDKDELMDELARNLMYDGDMAYSLWNMQRHGMRDSQGRRLPGLQDLLQRLRQRKQGQLDKYNLSSVMDEIRKKLEDVLNTEREGIQKRLDEARQKTQEGSQKTEGDAEGLGSEIQDRLLKQLEDMAAQNLERLDNLPGDIGGQIKELTDYDFMDAEAQQKFQELIEMLKQHAMQSYSQDLTDAGAAHEGGRAGLREVHGTVRRFLWSGAAAEPRRTDGTPPETDGPGTVPAR